MDRLEFRIKGNKRMKGLKTGTLRHLQGPAALPASWPLAFSGAGLVLWPLTLLVAAGLLASPSVKIGAWRIAAKNVLVVVDTSGSMDQHQARKDAVLARLHSSGINTGDQAGIWGSATNFLETIRDEAAKRPKLDAIWVVGDFYDGTDLDQDNRYRQLLLLLKRRRIKLFLSTVDATPHQLLISAAHASGGHWERL